MHPLVRDLYRRFLLVSRDYPLPRAECERRIKRGFMERANITNEEELLRAIHYGRYRVKEMIAVIQLRKYRQLRQKYSASSTTVKEEN